MEEFDHLDGEEKLKAENDFLKMKMMLEHGAQFGGNGNGEGSPELENQFLNYIMAFEKQAVAQKTIRLFDKIGRPQHFKPVAEISDNDMDKALDELFDFLSEHGISLDVCSPNISKRELYRFTIEELFEYEMDDMDIPGLKTNFIYDEFHPDPVYDNTRIATEDCINYILQNEPMEWTHHFKMGNLRLNQHYPLTIEQFKNLVNRFKLAYDSLEIERIETDNCTVNGKESWVTGVYRVAALVAKQSLSFSGQWKVQFELDEQTGYWYIADVAVEGILF